MRGDLFAFCLLPFAFASAQTPESVPAQLREVRIDQKLNAQVPLDLTFRDEAGRTVRLASYLGKRPAVLALVYYECPMLCNLVLNGVVRATRAIALDAGRDYSVIAVSINPRETPAEAAARKQTYISSYRHPGAETGWHFLTGEEGSIRALADAVGFRYTYDPRSGQYAHASGIMVLTPEGRLARYLYGVEYSARDLRLGLVEASAGKIGSPVDQVLLYCFHYDPQTGKYGPAIINALRAAGIVTVLGLSGLVFALIRRDRRPNRPARREA